MSPLTRHLILTLDDANVLRSAVDDPVGFVRGLDHAVIDEVQRVLDLLLAIKNLVDDDKTPGRFLLTGSANLMTLPRVADSLTGRMEVIRLLPLSQSEIVGSKSNFINRAFAGDVLEGFDYKQTAKVKTDGAGEFTVVRNELNHDELPKALFMRKEPFTKEAFSNRAACYVKSLEELFPRESELFSIASGPSVHLRLSCGFSSFKYRQKPKIDSIPIGVFSRSGEENGSIFSGHSHLSGQLWREALWRTKKRSV